MFFMAVSWAKAKEVDNGDIMLTTLVDEHLARDDRGSAESRGLKMWWNFEVEKVG